MSTPTHVWIKIEGDDDRNEFSTELLAPAHLVRIWLNADTHSDEENEEADEYFQDQLCDAFPNIEFRDFRLTPL